MTASFSNLSKRVAKVERRLSDVARRKRLAECDCNCRKVTLPRDPEEFEMEMNLPCPAHGFRDLGHLIRLCFVNPDRSVVEDPRMDELLATYQARRARHQADLELKEDDLEEF
jgi:hypothetical protein